MGSALRAEILKARSGFWMLAVLLYAVLLPLAAWYFARSSVATTSQFLLGFLGICPLAATFLGSFLTTREYYYKSILRTTLMQRKIHIYVAKCLAGALGGLVVGMVGGLGWTAMASLILSESGQVLTVEPGMLVGCVVACVLAGVFGVAVGWVLPNYYQATAVALVLPLAIELPLVLGVAPEVARFLPNSALAGVVRVPLPGLLPVAGSLAVFAGWLAITLLAGWKLYQRREIQG